MPVYRRKWKDQKTGKTRAGSYYFKFTVDGLTYKETVKTARTLKQAEEAERQARQEVHEGVYGRHGKKQLFSDFAEGVYMEWARQHHADTDNEQRRVSMLCEFFKGRTLAQVSQLAVEQFKITYAKTPTRCHRTRAARTVNLALATLSGILTRAVELRYVKENPCRKVRKLAVEEIPRRRLTPDAEAALLAEAEAEEAFLKPMIQLALWTGLRQGELIELRRSAVDFSRNRLFVVNPKWKRDRRKTEGNPMGEAVRDLLSGLCGRARGEYLFTDAKGRNLRRGHVDYLFRRTCRRAGLAGFRFHDLRHEYGSRLGDADVNLKKISRLMGHSTTKMTEQYVHPDEGGLLAATSVAAGGSTRIVPESMRAVV